MSTWIPQIVGTVLALAAGFAAGKGIVIAQTDLTAIGSGIIALVSVITGIIAHKAAISTDPKA